MIPLDHNFDTTTTVFSASVLPAPTTDDNFDQDYDRSIFTTTKRVFAPNVIPHLIMSHNVNGLLTRLKNKTFMDDFHSFLLRHDPDIICLQEVKLTPQIVYMNDDVPPLKLRREQDFFLAFCRRFEKDFNIFCSLADTKYAGQMVFVKKSLPLPRVTDVFEDFSPPDGRLIMFRFPLFMLLTVYVPNKGAGNNTSYERRHLWDTHFPEAVRKFRSRCPGVPLIICGDFNVAHTPSDVSGSLTWWRTICPFDDRPDHDQGYPGTTMREISVFKSMLDQASLVDTLLLPTNHVLDRHTVRGMGAMQGTSMRFDYFVISENHQHVVLESQVHNENFFGSDHCPISLRVCFDTITPTDLSNIDLYWSTCALACTTATTPFKPSQTSDHKFTYQELKAIYHIPGTLHYDLDVRHGLLTLFDGGATNGNFVHPYLFTIMPTLVSSVQPTPTSVQLGDQATTVSITHSVTLALSFYDESPVTSKFYILGDLTRNARPPGGPILIIGVPYLFREYGQVYKHLTDAAFTCFSPTSTDLDLCAFEYNPAPFPPDCVDPWLHPFSMIAPEDSEIDEITSYREFDQLSLQLFDRTYDEALADYKALFPTHIAQACIDQTDIVNVLLSPTALQVFVPRVWTGIDWPPIHIDFDPAMPKRLIPHRARVNPILYKPLEDEVNRLKEYQLRPSNSPIASPIVVAPKATKPFIRFCYNLQKVNGWIKLGHYPIPIIRDAIDRIGAHAVFIDTDMKRSYHQFKLDDETSAKLSVVTPFGQFEPIHLPEGVAPAQNILQHAMHEMFHSLGDWLIVIFDNVLICANSQQEAVSRFGLFLDRAAHYKVILSFDKTWIGFDEVKFFGYVCRQHSFKMDPARYDPLRAIPFPTPPKQISKIRSFLGVTRMYSPFVKDYAEYTAPLDEMTSAKFNWDESTWKRDYRAAFERLKDKLAEAQELFYPDYSLLWILRWDASDTAVGGVLFQMCPTSTGEHPQPIMFFSHKFSVRACFWHIFEKECFAGHHCLKKAEHMLRGHRFLMETDAKNLEAMEKCPVHKVIRMCNYYKSFDAKLRHISRKINHVADYFTHLCEKGKITSDEIPVSLLHMYTTYWDEEDHRAQLFDASPTSHSIVSLNSMSIFSIDPDFTLTMYSVSSDSIDSSTSPRDPVDEMIKTCHGNQRLHYGIRRTWLRLNDRHPGHGLPISVIKEFIDEKCGVCQKFRLGLRDQLPSVTRNLKVPDARHTVAVDTLTVSPISKDGYKYLIVMVNLFTHVVMIHPSKERDAHSIADALMHWIANRNLFRCLQHDPGSDIMSNVVQILLSYLGIQDCVTLVDSPRSNGVEPTNKAILRHLNTLVHDARLVTHWSDPKFLCLVQFELNNWLHSESGAIPFEAEMGSTEEIFRTLPTDLSREQKRIAYVAELDRSLKVIRENMAKWQSKVVHTRAQHDPDIFNSYAVGDLVLHANNKNFRPTKLWCPFAGPFKVLKVEKDDVTCDHLSSFTTFVFKNDTLKPFFGSLDEAERIAQMDFDFFTVTNISHYTGDPLRRTTLEFCVTYSDGDWQWRRYGLDLASTDHFKNFVHAHPELYLLNFPTSNNVAFRELQRMRRAKITLVKPGDSCFVHLRAFGATWYQSTLDLPDTETTDYVVPCSFTQWLSTRSNLIELSCSLFNRRYEWTNHDVYSYGTMVSAPVNAVLITTELVHSSPVLTSYVQTD